MSVFDNDFDIPTFTYCPTKEVLDRIRICDIAASLAKQCRYGGHSKIFYSVAEHCVHLCDYVAGLGRDV